MRTLKRQIVRRLALPVLWVIFMTHITVLLIAIGGFLRKGKVGRLIQLAKLKWLVIKIEALSRCLAMKFGKNGEVKLIGLSTIISFIINASIIFYILGTMFMYLKRLL